MSYRLSKVPYLKTENNIKYCSIDETEHDPKYLFIVAKLCYTDYEVDTLLTHIVLIVFLLETITIRSLIKNT